jgi:hypothetical protein
MENEAAARVLVAALDCPVPAVQEGALSTLLQRRTLSGGRDILRRMPGMKEPWKAIIRLHPGRLTHILRDALLADDQPMCNNACLAAVAFHEYDLIPTLLTALDDPHAPNGETAVRTLIELVGLLYEELAGPRNAANRRDPQLIRRHAVSRLELSVQRFAKHKRREAVECFLLLVGRENVTLKQILQNPYHAAYAAVVDVLAKSLHGGVIRLLLSYLDDPHVPAAALSVIANRIDLKFVQYLLRKIGREPSPAVAQNLKRMENIPWLRSGHPLLEQLDDAGQHAAVRLIMASGMPRALAFAALEQLLVAGKPAGRREAARALAEFSGTEANALAMKALGDADPQVQANVIVQLRHRGIPGILPRLLEQINSPHEVVRRAARESLGEFSFKRFLASFDGLDEEIRRNTAALVRKIDPQSLPLLQEEMRSPARTRRLRAVSIARAMAAEHVLEDSLLGLLEDEDHMVRVEAATALARSATPNSREALKVACRDSSEMVRQAAQRSLDEQAQFNQGREYLFDPRD